MAYTTITGAVSLASTAITVSAVNAVTGTFSGIVSAAAFAGPITGNVTGNVTGTAINAVTGDFSSKVSSVQVKGTSATFTNKVSSALVNILFQLGISSQVHRLNKYIIVVHLHYFQSKLFYILLMKW